MAKDGIKTAANLRLENTFYISQKMLNSLQILQMDSLSLEKHIAEQLMENPVLEYPQVYGRPSEGISWDRIRGDGGREYDTLEFFLLDQLARLDMDPKVKQLCRNLVRLIDEKGYLQTELLSREQLGDMRYPEALKILQSLEPAGVAAGDLRECLLLQLERMDSEEILAELLIRDHLEDISRRNYKKLQKATGATMEELQDAIKTILTLNPRPGAGFESRNQTSYIHPDFVITLEDGRLEIRQEERSFLTLSVSDYYIRLYHSTVDAEVKRYLKERIRAAKQLALGLENRKSTTLRCMEAILQIQEGFFLNPSRQLMPLTLERISQMLDLHISTVSRAVSGKYLEFEGQLYPLKFFFTRSIREGGATVSTAQIKELIRQIIENEAPGAPMTDQQIVHILLQGGNNVPRRTVAKYREQMGIPASKQRRML